MEARDCGISLATGEVHVWFARPASLDTAALERCAQVLSAEERERISRFHFAHHRREATVSRSLVRKTLARYVERPASEFRYRLGPYGRPHIDPPCGVAFNATNHPDFVACAVSLDEEIGIDTEPLSRGAAILEVASTVFSVPERGALAALPAASRPDRAVSLWTCKEAYVKARSLGLAASLQSVVVDFLPGGALRLGFLASYDEPANWWLSTRDVLGFRIAVALRTTAKEVKLIVREAEWDER